MMPMNMLDTFIKPMHPEGRKFVAIAAGISVLAFMIWDPLGWICLGLTVWTYYFFRDPKRSVPDARGLILSPADGVISLIERAVPPPELGAGDGPLLRVSVFMSVFNCHVNRAPIAGKLVKMAYRPGKFLNASMDKASEDNERNSLLFDIEGGRKLVVVQIAGLIARRIVPFVTEGQTLRTGERFGLIRFGSRLDVYLPEGIEPMVCLGQTMIAGETVIGELGRETLARSANLE
jgi:phosphatidylserine decarboxylase